MSDVEGLITDAFGMVIVFDNVIGDASCAGAILIEMIPYALRWNKNRGGTKLPFNVFKTNCTIYLHLSNSAQR